MKTLADAFLFEHWFDDGCKDENLIAIVAQNPARQICHDLLTAYLAKNWAEVFLCAERVLSDGEASLYAKVLCLQFAVSACEEIYDLNLRTHWLGKWNLIKGWASCNWCLHIRTFQDALTPFFAGHLRDAESGFQLSYEYATTQGYVRGRMRCLFHLGLISSERGLRSQALNQFKDAHVISANIKAPRFQKRVQNEIRLLVKNGVEESFLEINKMLEEGAFLAALRLIREHSRVRRIEKYKRNSDMSEVFYALTCIGLKREGRAAKFFARVDDPVLKEFYYSRKQEIFGLTADEDAEMRYLRVMVGIKAVQTDHLGAIVAIPKGDLPSVDLLDPTVADRHAEEIARQIVERAHTVAGRLRVHDPRRGPHRR